MVKVPSLEFIQVYMWSSFMGAAEWLRPSVDLISVDLTQSRAVIAASVPTAPARHAGETLKVRRNGPPGLPLMLGDASQGLRNLSLQVGNGVLCSAAPGDFANRKPGSFQGLQGIAVLLELNPMPGDFAVAVTTHRESPDSP
jgi:hypothetical protein